MKLSSWKSKLNKKDLEHIIETIDGRITLEAVVRNCVFQNQQKFPCLKCVDIGRKLGLTMTLDEFYKNTK